MGKREPLIPQPISQIRVLPEDQIAAARRLNAILMSALQSTLVEAEALKRELTSPIDIPVDDVAMMPPDDDMHDDAQSPRESHSTP